MRCSRRPAARQPPRPTRPPTSTRPRLTGARWSRRSPSAPCATPSRPLSPMPEAVEQAVELQTVVNGRPHRATVPSRLLLSDFLRHELGLYGTHVGCEHGACGACTVLLDGAAVRSCLLLA